MLKTQMLKMTNHVQSLLNAIRHAYEARPTFLRSCRTYMLPNHSKDYIRRSEDIVEDGREALYRLNLVEFVVSLTWCQAFIIYILM